MLSDLAILWNRSHLSNDHRNTIGAIFAILFEEDHGFLSECCRSMDREAFTDLLFILETLMDESTTQSSFPVGLGHPTVVHRW